MRCPHCEKEISGKTCPECGSETPGEARYCMECGSLLEYAGEETAGAEDVREETADAEDDEIDFENRVLCPDGTCTGIIVDGKCTECGKPLVPTGSTDKGEEEEAETGEA
ncbi:MAG: zinc-ribbon domain-containing protein [Desulfatiglandaceae bacterium]|jgi:hypothetical protein